MIIDYLIILVLSVLSTLKVSFQGAFSKHSVRNTADAIAFNGLVFAVSAILFLYRIPGCSRGVWIYAAFGAGFTVLFQLFYAKALSVGNVSLTALIVNFNMLINVMVSYFVYHEPMSAARLLGVILTVLSFLVCTEFKGGKRSEKKWLFLAIGAMLATSGLSIVQKIFGKSEYREQTQAFVSCMYVVAMLLTIVVYGFLKKTGGGKSFKSGKRPILFALAVGVSLAVYQLLNTYAISVIDGTFFFPVHTGGNIVLSTLSGVLVFKDRLKPKQVFGIFIGIVAVVLMNF